MKLRIGRTYLIGKTRRRAIVLGWAKRARTGSNRRLMRVRAGNGLGGHYEELYRPDGSWPFNTLGNFNLRDIARSRP